jgi:hypothetical protein
MIMLQECIAMTEAPNTLETLASEADALLDRARNRHWLSAALREGHARDFRIAAGQILAQANDRVRAGEPGHRNWARWVRENIKHSYRDANACIALARSRDPSTLAGSSEVTADDPIGTAVPPVVTIYTIQREILLLNAKDRSSLIEWLAPHNEVQRDQYGSVQDPLPIRLKRVLHRLRNGRRSSPGRELANQEQLIYDEVNSIALLILNEKYYDRMINLQFMISSFVSDLMGRSSFSEIDENYANGLRELEIIVIEFDRQSAAAN